MIRGDRAELELLVKLFNWELMENIGRIRLEGFTTDLEEVVCYGDYCADFAVRIAAKWLGIREKGMK